MKKQIVYMICSFASIANAQVYTLLDNSFEQSTYLVEIKQDSTLNQKARSIRNVAYETADGSQVDLYKWYMPSMPEAHLTWLTQVTRNFGVLWGFGTGEYANKYTIEPSLKIGFVYQRQINKNHSISFMADTYLGGNLKEHTCMADYGEIGGIREVNCRLAASLLTPEETLSYLEQGKQDGSIRFSYKFTF